MEIKMFTIVEFEELSLAVSNRLARFGDYAGLEIMSTKWLFVNHFMKNVNIIVLTSRPKYATLQNLFEV